LPGELTHDVPDKEMLAIVFSLRKWRHFLQGAEYKTIVYSEYHNLTCFKTTIALNRRQARLAEDLQSFDFDIFYLKGSSNLKANTLSRCPEFTSGEEGTTAGGYKTFLQKQQWLEVGAMLIDDKETCYINVGAMDIEQQLPETKECIKEKALLHENCRMIWKQLMSGGNLDKEYGI